MAKNTQNAESNGGFKTVAFGFDKNDVNMYIANLRKKMKQMEEEFEQKLSSALENPAASSDALKHEREVIRAETEKLWGEKLNERNQILKQQQVRINELEDELRVNKEKVASLRTQLAAATSENNSDGVIRARAAKAYMQFTRELRYISGSVEKTLEKMEQQWRGEFGDEASEPAEPQENAANSYVNAQENGAADVHKNIPVNAQENVSENVQASAPVNAKINVDANTTANDQANSPANVQASASENIPVNTQPTAPENIPAKKRANAAAKIRKNAQTNTAAAAQLKTLPEDLESPKKEDPLTGLIADIASPEEDGGAVMDIDTDLLAETPAPVQASVSDSANTENTAAHKQPDTAHTSGNTTETTVKSGAKPITMPAPKTETKAAEAVSNSARGYVDPDMLIDEPKKQPVPEAAVSDDFDSLLADDDSMDEGLAFSPPPAPAAYSAPTAVIKPEKAKPKIEIDDDLSALLAEDDISDLLVTPADSSVGANDEFEKLMSEPKPEHDYGEDILFDEADKTAPKGEDLDASVLSDIVINPGEQREDLSEMLKAQEKAEEVAFNDMFVTAADDTERNDGLGISVGNIDFGMDSADELSAKAKNTKPAKKDDDLFDFSFLMADDNDDDMSTDVSFPGML